MLCYAVPLCISGVHLFKTDRLSFDCAVQFYVLAALLMAVEQGTSTKFAAVLLSPFVLAGTLGLLFEVVGDAFWRPPAPGFRRR
jgi:hypothetical protein